MKYISRIFLLCILSIFVLLSLDSHARAKDDFEHFYGFGSGKIVVANRGDGSISVISTALDQEVEAIELPVGDNPPEPMYVVYTWAGHRVFVGDRGNDRVVVFDADDFSVEDTIPAGAGVFHMWADPQNQQLWVVNDIDNTATVISPWTLGVIATVPMPEDLIREGGRPHDVVLDLLHAYVTIVGLETDDYVVKFKRHNFNEVGRQMVGKDSHLSLTLLNRNLYVPSQNSDTVFVLKRRTLRIVDEIPVPGAHGAGMTLNGKVFYTTNLPGGGAAGLFAISTRKNKIIGGPVDTPFPVPHNIAITPNGRKLYITHSGGSSDQVSVYSASKRNPVPVFRKSLTVGINPFGIAYVP